MGQRHAIVSIAIAYFAGPAVPAGLMPLCATQGHATVPGATIYNAAIRACEVDLQRQQARRLLRMMQRRTIVPNVITYNAAFGPCDKGQRCQQAVRLSRAT